MGAFKPALFLILFGSFIAFPQEQTFTENERSINKFTDGILTFPSEIENPPLVIFIQGSGPTNRDGNSPQGMHNKSDFTKKLAYALANNKIASFRFDKRSIKAQELNLETISFDDFIIDVENILNYFKKENNFSKIIIAGHSQGSLIGMLAAKNNADAFISLAGAGESIDYILVEQLSKTLPVLEQELREGFNELKIKGSTENFPPLFASYFTPKAQKFLASWIKYDPSEEIAKLKIPVLIVQGTRDIQVKEKQAKILYKAAPNSKLVLLQDMNHVLREIKEEEKDLNIASYTSPEKPLHPELIPVLTNFIKNLENK